MRQHTLRKKRCLNIFFKYINICQLSHTGIAFFAGKHNSIPYNKGIANGASVQCHLIEVGVLLLLNCPNINNTNMQ